MKEMRNERFLQLKYLLWGVAYAIIIALLVILGMIAYHCEKMAGKAASDSDTLIELYGEVYEMKEVLYVQVAKQDTIIQVIKDDMREAGDGSDF